MNMLKYVTLLLLLTLYVFSSSSSDYGSFNLFMNKFETCKGPKRKDCCVSSGEIINGSTILYDALVNENTTPNKGKIVAMSKGKEFLRLQMNKPCDHLFLRPLFQTMMNVTKNCIVLKGHYHFNINIQELAQRYYGGSFLFGNWTFKAVFYNDECNFSCSVIDVELSPQDKTTQYKL